MEINEQMPQEKTIEDYDSHSQTEDVSLLGHITRRQNHRPWNWRLLAILSGTHGILLLILIVLWVELDKSRQSDPGLAIYSPANEVVEYIDKLHFRAALLNTSSPYMGYPTDETDRLWEDLYNWGISKIPEEKAKKLNSPTLAIPGTKDYLIELDVFHQLHCLNDLRTLLYPERYFGMKDITDESGLIDRRADAFLHWDHCIDAIRQTLMCHADISPIPFHVNVPANKGIFPRLSTTHTCRNFTKIQEWARENNAGRWDFNLTPELADIIIAQSGFDHSPQEDIEFLYESFPNHTFFKYWRDHPLPPPE